MSITCAISDLMDFSHLEHNEITARQKNEEQRHGSTSVNSGNEISFVAVVYNLKQLTLSVPHFCRTSSSQRHASLFPQRYQIYRKNRYAIAK